MQCDVTSCVICKSSNVEHLNMEQSYKKSYKELIL